MLDGTPVTEPGEPNDDLLPELRAFLQACIESITQVELLVILHQSEGTLTTRELATCVQVPVAAARRDLEVLSARGLLDVEVAGERSFRFRPASPDLERCCVLLADAYVRARPAIIGHLASVKRLRMSRFVDL